MKHEAYKRKAEKLREEELATPVITIAIGVGAKKRSKKQKMEKNQEIIEKMKEWEAMGMTETEMTEMMKKEGLSEEEIADCFTEFNEQKEKPEKEESPEEETEEEKEQE